MSDEPKVVAIIQARMGSSRLPGKVLMRLGDRSVLAWVVRAAAAAHQVDTVAVATSTAVDDDKIVEACGGLDVQVLRGSEHDVLGRYDLAAAQTGADAVVRLNADCPLLDPAIIDLVVSLWRAEPTLDYVSTSLYRTLPLGLDVELATASALHAAASVATGHDRVHVTSSLYHVSSTARRAGIVFAPSNADLRVTLDVKEDLEVLRALVLLLGNGRPSWRSVVEMLRSHPELAALNAHVKQKQLEDE